MSQYITKTSLLEYTDADLESTLKNLLIISHPGNRLVKLVQEEIEIRKKFDILGKQSNDPYFLFDESTGIWHSVSENDLLAVVMNPEKYANASREEVYQAIQECIQLGVLRLNPHYQKAGRKFSG